MIKCYVKTFIYDQYHLTYSNYRICEVLSLHFFLMALDKAFLELPETETFNVFRVEKFNIVPWKDIGQFYSGDAYIVLSAVKVAQSDRIERDIYFWLGTDSTQDEQGTAAIKTVELDDRFDGEPTQHREVQGHESDEFLELFDKYGGIRYLDGGIETGFRKPTGTEPHTMLFHIKGRKHPVLQQVKVSGESLNQGDAFILVTAKTLYLWIGSSANYMEKNKAAQSFSGFRSIFPKHDYVRLDDGETSPEFWEALGGETPIKSAAAGGADAEHEASNTRKIYQIENGKFNLIAEGSAATRDKLEAGKVYIVSRGENAVVFFGEGISRDQIKHGIQKGVDFLKANNLPTYTSITVARAGKPSGRLALLFSS